MRATRVLLAALAVLAAVPVRAEITAPGKGPRHNTTTDADWLRHPHDDKYYTESWTVMGRSTEGHIFALNFLYSNIGVFSGSTAVRLTFAMPGEQAKRYVHEHSTGEFGQDARIGRVGVGRSWMALKGRKLEVVAKEKDFSMHLHLTATSKGAKFRDGRIYVDGDRKQWVDFYMHMPWARFRGEVEVDGRTFTLEGDGHVDHWVQNVLSTDYCARMWTLRQFDDDYAVALIVQEPLPAVGKTQMRRLMIASRTGVVYFGDRLDFEGKAPVNDPKGHRYDTVYQVTHQSKAATLAGTVKSARLYDRDSILDRLNAAQQQVVKMVAGNPVVYRMVGDAKLTLTVSGKKHTLDAPALMESVVMTGSR